VTPPPPPVFKIKLCRECGLLAFIAHETDEFSYKIDSTYAHAFEPPLPVSGDTIVNAPRITGCKVGKLS
jgi:hypothetical protein